MLKFSNILLLFAAAFWGPYR